MDDTGAPTKPERQPKVKDLETEPESINECGKRECMDVMATTNSFIKENESLRRELDSTRGQLKNLQKCLEEAELKYKADVELLMIEIKSLRSSQSQLRQGTLQRVEKDLAPLLIERTGASSVLDVSGLNRLPDDVLIAILSSMTLVEAVRTSVLSRRWRHLWRFTSGSLDFDDYKIKTGDAGKVITWVNRVIELHQGPQLDSFSVRLSRGGVDDNSMPRWIYFAMQKEVKKFELKLGRGNRSGYYFAELHKLLSLKCAFGSLRSLKFSYVNIADEVVHYLLESCPILECLSITGSNSIRNLEIVDPIPNLKTLEISYCYSLESLKVSAASIVSFSLGGPKYDDNKLIFENIPNLTELSLKGHCAESFIYEYNNNKHASYSVQLVKLSLYLSITIYAYAVPHSLPLLYSLKRLELSTGCRVERSLLFFTLLIKAAPILNEFRIKVDYCNHLPIEFYSFLPFPDISEAEAPTFHHENLKLVEMVGYIGCLSEEKFLLHLFKVAPSLEKVVIEVNKKHFYKKSKLQQRIAAGMKKDAKEHAKHLVSIIPPNTQLVVR